MPCVVNTLETTLINDNAVVSWKKMILLVIIVLIVALKQVGNLVDH